MFTFFLQWNQCYAKFRRYDHREYEHILLSVDIILRRKHTTGNGQNNRTDVMDF